jgi:hypothetical protein
MRNQSINFRLRERDANSNVVLSIADLIINYLFNENICYYKHQR